MRNPRFNLAELCRLPVLAADSAYVIGSPLQVDLTSPTPLGKNANSTRVIALTLAGIGPAVPSGKPANNLDPPVHAVDKGGDPCQLHRDENSEERAARPIATRM
jgi:hypothetical protein